MDHYVVIDVSLEQSSVCLVDATGRIVREAKVASEPEALAAFLAGRVVPLVRVGLEAGPLSQWLHAGLTAAGYDVVLLETATSRQRSRPCWSRRNPCATVAACGRCIQGR